MSKYNKDFQNDRSKKTSQQQQGQPSWQNQNRNSQQNTFGNKENLDRERRPQDNMKQQQKDALGKREQDKR